MPVDVPGCGEWDAACGMKIRGVARERRIPDPRSYEICHRKQHKQQQQQRMQQHQQLRSQRLALQVGNAGSVRKQDAAAHGRRVQHTICDDEADWEKEVGGGQERDGSPANANENGGGASARAEHGSQHEVRHQSKRDEKRKCDNVAIV